MADITTIIYFAIIGGFAGWLASRLITGRGLGLFADIAVGIIGAVLGGLIFGQNGSTLMTFFTAFVGAVILLAVIRLIRRI